MGSPTVKAKRMISFYLIWSLFILFLFLSLSNCCLLKPGGTVVVEERLAGLVRGRRSVETMDQTQTPTTSRKMSGEETDIRKMSGEETDIRKMSGEETDFRKMS